MSEDDEHILDFSLLSGVSPSPSSLICKLSPFDREPSVEVLSSASMSPDSSFCKKGFRIKVLLASHASSLFVGYDEQHTLKICLMVEDFAGVLLLRRKVISKDFEDCAKKLTYLDLQEFEGIAAALRKWL
jgi:hypothetical protein